MFQINVIFTHLPDLLDGALITLVLACVAYAIGAVLGSAIHFLTMQRFVSLRWFAKGYIDFFRTIPELVPIIWLYACMPFILQVDLSATTVGIVAFSLITAAFFAEIVRTGLDAVPDGQREAAHALGLRGFTVMRKIIVPQAVVVMLPPALNLFSDVVKMSSLLSLIGVAELTYRTAVLSASTYKYLEFYTCAGIIYLAIIVFINAISSFAGAYFSRHLKVNA